MSTGLLIPERTKPFMLVKVKATEFSSHANVESNSGDEKLKRIREIEKDGFEVLHIYS